jgi:signal transduction histidine kinase
MDLSLPLGVEPADTRIFIAEDDPASAAVLRAVLGRVGYQMEVAPDGAAMLELLDAEGPPDLLLLDWMLPGVSGLEICHRVRQRWDQLELPILMVTAKADAESISAAFDAGASDYLAKPFLGAELRARIAAHLRGRQLLLERQRIDQHLREREKLSSLGLLVSGVAHDLSNPLVGIAGYAQLLLRDEVDPEKRSDLERIVAEAGRAQRIVRNLLGFARRHPAERGPIDLESVVRATLELRDQHFRTAQLAAELVVEGEVGQVLGDPHQLQQAFVNVVLNAEQALRHSGTGLRVTVRPQAVAGKSNWMAVEFYNDGPPISPEVLPHIFDPFFTTKGSEEGTGLGLPITQRIARELGGDLQVESGAEGTTFRFLLPAAAEIAAPVTLFQEGSGLLRR